MSEFLKPVSPKTAVSRLADPANSARPWVLVTGGAKRIGRGLALAFAQSGFNLALHYRGSQADAEQTAHEAGAQGATVALFQAELSDPNGATGLAAAIDGAGISPALLINNASAFRDDQAADFSADAYDLHMNVHVRTPMVLGQWMARLAETAQRRASIINMIDQRVLNPSARHFTYAVSKQALWGVTQQLALDLAPNIRVNAIAPGPVLPPPGSDGSTFHEQTAAMPLGQGASVEDITRAALFLTEMTSMTGTILPVDGGQHLGYMSPGEAHRFVSHGVRPG